MSGAPVIKKIKLIHSFSNLFRTRFRHNENIVAEDDMGTISQAFLISMGCLLEPLGNKISKRLLLDPYI